MKRAGASVVVAFLIFSIVGCDSGGMKEGSPPGPVQNAQPAGFKEMMEKAQAKKDQMRKGRDGMPAGPAKKAP
jgi:hypothetical protein